MKKLLLPLLLFSFNMVCAQPKAEPFIKKHLFARLSPTVFIPKGGNLTPAALGTVGVKVHRYVAVGVSGGYFEYNHEEKGFVPLGVDLVLADFKAKKIAPIITAQLFKPINYEKNGSDSWRSSVGQPFTELTKTTAKSLFSVAAGAGIPLGSNKLALTAGYSQLTFRKKTTVSTISLNGRPSSNSYINYTNIPMANICLSYIF
jgi:hypothetical protein